LLVCCLAKPVWPVLETGLTGFGTNRGLMFLISANSSIHPHLDDIKILSEAKLAEEYRAVRLLRASIAGEASARDERVRELGKKARACIDADFNVDEPNTLPCASQKLITVATLLRAMPAPSTPVARNLHREAQALIEQAAVQHTESSASRIRQ
jgi:hypothetical protein